MQFFANFFFNPQELVTKLKLQVYSPGDYVCRKGDIGKEMYIIQKGLLNVVSDDGTKVFVTLKEGAFFGEISILNIPGNKIGNRRTANVQSQGYSDLLRLTKADLWQALEDYPQNAEILIAKGKAKLRKDGLLEEDEGEAGKEHSHAGGDVDDEFRCLSTEEKIRIIEGVHERLEVKLAEIAAELKESCGLIGDRVQAVKSVYARRIGIKV